MVKKHKATAMPVADVVAGDTVSLPDGKAFQVAGVRKNPVDSRVRLFDSANVMRLELEPTAEVEVER